MDITFGDTGESLTQGVKTVIVGQKINLRLKPANASNISWTVPGVRVADYKVDYNGPNSTVSTAAVTELTQNQTNGNQVTYYWVDGSLTGVRKEVQVAFRVGGKNRTKKALFDVVRPEAFVSASATGAITVDSNFDEAGTYVHYGKRTGTPGVKFLQTSPIIKPSGFDGIVQWVQVVYEDRQYRDGAGPHTSRQIGNDRYYPYTLIVPDQINANDSPGQLLLSGMQEMIISDNYDMYLMFKPSLNESIWVPLKKVTWGWRANVTPTTFSWSLNSSSKVGPTIADEVVHPVWMMNRLQGNFVP
jgi:hypothetical protein